MGEKERNLNELHSLRNTEWSEDWYHNTDSNLALRNAISFIGGLPSQ